SEIWQAAVAACRDNLPATITLLPALNAMFDIAATRIAATRMHPPAMVYVVLEMLSLACGFLVGYEMGATASTSRPHIVVVTLLLTCMLYVIMDFEYPRLGLIKIDDYDQIIVQVRAQMG